MSQVDDRDQFEAHKVEMCRALGKDEAVFNQTLDTMVALDKYDYSYLWSWMGLPVIQMPADVMATQEVIWNTQPDVIVETGVARGGSVIFMAAMLQLIGKGKVVGVDIDIRSHNREAIESHPLSHRVELIEGPSTSAETMEKVIAAIPAGASVMVVLDSDHSKAHVLDELRNYAPLVSPGQYLVVADTLLGRSEPSQVPTKRSKVLLPGDDPLAALNEYLAETDRFESDDVINGKLVLCSSPGGYMKCVKD